MVTSSSTSNEAHASLDDTAYSMLFVQARTETLHITRLNNFFVCKLCKGYFRDPYTSKECLHTFCYGCIRGYYLYHPKSSSCPTCGVNLGAKPLAQILPDPAKKELVDKLLPDCRAKDESDERMYYKKFGIKHKQPDIPNGNQLSSLTISRSLGPSPGNMIRFELHPQRGPEVPLFLSLGKLRAPYMHTQSLLKIMYLRKYLSKKLKVAKPQEIEILCKGAIVGPEYSLEFVRRTRWKEENSNMILEYRRQLLAS